MCRQKSITAWTKSKIEIADIQESHRGNNAAITEHQVDRSMQNHILMGIEETF
jgi:hypothetical protein